MWVQINRPLLNWIECFTYFTMRLHRCFRGIIMDVWQNVTHLFYFNELYKIFPTKWWHKSLYTNTIFQQLHVIHHRHCHKVHIFLLQLPFGNFTIFLIVKGIELLFISVSSTNLEYPMQLWCRFLLEVTHSANSAECLNKIWKVKKAIRSVNDLHIYRHPFCFFFFLWRVFRIDFWVIFF